MKINQKTMQNEKEFYHLKDTLKHVAAIQMNCVNLFEQWDKDELSFVNIFNNLRELSSTWQGTVIGQICSNSAGYDVGFTDPVSLCIRALTSACLKHDTSKVDGPEYDGYVDVVYKLNGLEYGTPEHTAAIAELDKPFEQHAARNPHHPEYYGGRRGDIKVPLVLDMNIINFVEMILDWTAAAVCRGFKFRLSSIEAKRDSLDLDDLTIEVIQRNIKLILPPDLIIDDIKRR